MLTYKFGGAAALPQAFLIYSFCVQCVFNFILVLVFRNKEFPIILRGRMRLWVIWVALVYLVNEMLFMTVYRMGAPYALMMTVFALTSVVIMTTIAIVFIKERVSKRQILGIILALVAIALVRLG